MVTTKTNLPDPATNGRVRRAVTLPFNCTGMAFTPHTRSSPAAWYSSMAAAARHIKAHRSDSEIRDRLQTTDTAAHLADTHALLLASGVDPAVRANKERVPAAAADFWPFYTSESKIRPVAHLQGHLTQQLTKRRYLSDNVIQPCLDSEPPEDRSEPYNPSTTELLFTTFPTSSFTNIADHEFQLALRHRLHLPVVDHLPLLCHPKPDSHGHNCTAVLANDPAHFHSCKLRRKRGTYMRHEKVTLCLQALGRRAGLSYYQQRACSS